MEAKDRTPADWVALNGAVNSTAHLDERAGKPVVIGNSTEGALLHWLREGKLRPHVSARYTLEETPRALADMAHRRVTGKIVITP